MKPWLDDGDVVLYHGDCRDVLPALEADAVIADPPYATTSLGWDAACEGWLELVRPDSVWVFGSLRSLLALDLSGWTVSQDVIWEKHNGSNFHADRFRRVHEQAVHLYRGSWADLYHSPPVTMDATARTVRRKGRPPHTGHIDATPYASEDGGPRLMRSVIYCRSEHGRAVHPTQKPVGIMRPLVQYACPPGGVVIDPFIGSGTTAVACREVGRRCIGVEADERYLEAAARRLAQTQLLTEEVA